MKKLQFYSKDIPDKWDNIEIEKCKLIQNKYAEPVYGNEKGDFYSVFLHDINGGVRCIADLPTKKDAIKLTSLLKNMVKSYKNNGYLK